jgi:signal transduction histidine kinase
MYLRLPIRTRLAGAFSVILAVVLTASGVAIMWGFREELNGVIDAEITALAREFAKDLEDGETGVLQELPVAAADGLFGLVMRDGGGIEEVSAGVALEARDVTPRPELQVVETVLPGVPGPGVRLVAVHAPEGLLVVVGRALGARDLELDGLRNLLMIGGPALLAVIAASAWLLAAASLRPVERLRLEAERISEGDLGRRLPEPETGDEIERLARTLNEMLARLEQGFERERRIVDDASHELRTPLAILKTGLDLALRSARTPDELRKALADATEVSGDLNRLAENMLVLARTSRGRLELHRTCLDAGEFVARLAERFQPLADRRGVKLVVAVPANLRFEADELRLGQALGNLVDNAIGYSPEGGSVRIEAWPREGAEVCLNVLDSGPGFPPDFLARAWLPFSRADFGRSRERGGAGLGLAIVKGIAEAHGGRVEAANRETGGAVVTIALRG